MLDERSIARMERMCWMALGSALTLLGLIGVVFVSGNL